MVLDERYPCREIRTLYFAIPFSGSNWMLDMLSMLRSNTNELNSVMTPPVEVFPGASHAKTPPRTLLTHLPYRLMPGEHVQKVGKIILMVRNPKDCVVSTFRFAQKSPTHPFDGDFEEFLQYFTTGVSKLHGHCNMTSHLGVK